LVPHCLLSRCLVPRSVALLRRQARGSTWRTPRQQQPVSGETLKDGNMPFHTPVHWRARSCFACASSLELKRSTQGMLPLPLD
jgi:hypothetical protein